MKVTNHPCFVLCCLPPDVSLCLYVNTNVAGLSDDMACRGEYTYTQVSETAVTEGKIENE